MEDRDPIRRDAFGTPPPEPDALGIGREPIAPLPPSADETEEGEAAEPAVLTGFYACPHCSAQFVPPVPPDDGFPRCPACGQQFFAPDESGEDEQVLDELETRHRGREATLSDVRIRQISALRRGLYRARTYFIIAAAACAMFAVQLSVAAFRLVRASGIRARPVLYVVAAVALLMLCRRFLWRIGELNREAAEPILADPTTPPDFSTLSDGSQGWKNLELLGAAPDVRQNGLPFDAEQGEPTASEPPATLSEWRS